MRTLANIAARALREPDTSGCTKNTHIWNCYDCEQPVEMPYVNISETTIRCEQCFVRMHGYECHDCGEYQLESECFLIYQDTRVCVCKSCMMQKTDLYDIGAMNWEKVQTEGKHDLHRSFTFSSAKRNAWPESMKAKCTISIQDGCIFGTYVTWAKNVGTEKVKYNLMFWRDEHYLYTQVLSPDVPSKTERKHIGRLLCVPRVRASQKTCRCGGLLYNFQRCSCDVITPCEWFDYDEWEEWHWKLKFDLETVSEHTYRVQIPEI